MEEMLRISAETWQSYWGEGYGSILTAVSFLYLLLFPGERKNRKALAGYTVVFLFLYFFFGMLMVLQEAVASDVFDCGGVYFIRAEVSGRVCEWFYSGIAGSGDCILREKCIFSWGL